jgi:hypothetical protein
MREIKFRAWDNVQRKMINVVNLNLIDGDVWCNGKLDVELMQFTGLLDKNGVEIYEGDILDFEELEWGGKFTPEVVPPIQTLITDGFPLCGSVRDVAEWRTVIGNIHQNPELLEAK